MYYRLNTEGAPSEVAGVLEWVIRSLGEDPMVRKDAERLNDLLSDEAAAKCGS